MKYYYLDPIYIIKIDQDNILNFYNLETKNINLRLRGSNKINESTLYKVPEHILKERFSNNYRKFYYDYEQYEYKKEIFNFLSGNNSIEYYSSIQSEIDQCFFHFEGINKRDHHFLSQLNINSKREYKMNIMPFESDKEKNDEEDKINFYYEKIDKIEFSLGPIVFGRNYMKVSQKDIKYSSLYPTFEENLKTEILNFFLDKVNTYETSYSNCLYQQNRFGKGVVYKEEYFRPF